MADVQTTLRGTRRKTSIQRKRQMEYEDEGDDDDEEEKLHMPAKKQNGTINVENSSTEASIKTEEAKAPKVQKNAGKATSSTIQKPLKGFKANPSVPALPTQSQPALTTPSSAKPSSRAVEALKKRKSKRSKLQ